MSSLIKLVLNPGRATRRSVGFVGQNKKWWLAPILLSILLLGVLVALGSTAAAPFIYTLF